MILSISNERVAQIKAVARFAGLSALAAIAVIALFLYLVSAFGLHCGRVVRGRFERWGGFSRLDEVVSLATIQEGSGFWGAAHWAAQYSFTATAIALIFIVRTAVYLYEVGAALVEEYRSSPCESLRLLPATQPAQTLYPQLRVLPVVKPLLALPAATDEPAQRGRKPALTAEQKRQLRQQRTNGASYEQLCAQFGVSRSTVKRSLRAA